MMGGLMTMHTPSNTWTLHIARSQFIDAFASVERAVITVLKSNNAKSSAVLGQNLEELRKLTPSPQLSKHRKAEIDDLAKRIDELRAIRCDIVHGEMSVVAIDNEQAGLFRNPQIQCEFSTPARALTAGQFKQATHVLAEINKALISLSRPSRPPPLPDAAAGP